MAKLTLKKASTSVTVEIFIQDYSKGDGSGLTGLVFNTTSLTAYYVRPLGSATAITLATLAAATSAWSSGGFKEIDATNMPGVYRLDIPDAVLATGVSHAVVMLKGAANMAPVALEIELVAYDPQDAVRAGLTALPNATAGANGGLPTGDANAAVKVQAGTGTGQLDFTSGVVKSNLVQILATALTETAGQIAAGFKKLFDVATPVLTTASVNQTGDSFARIGAPTGASVSADIADLPTNAELATSQAAADDATLAAIAALNNLSSSGAQTAAEAAIVAKNLDKLIVGSGAVVDLGNNTTSFFEATANENTVSGAHSGSLIVFTSGPCAGTSKQCTICASSGGTTVTFTFGTAAAERLVAIPLVGNTYIVLAVRSEIMRGTNSAALASNYTATRAGYLDLINTNLNATVSSRSSHSAADVWTSATRTLTSFGTLTTDTATSVWNALTSGMATVGSIGKKIADWVIGTSQTGDSFARLGAPAGASVSADIAAIKADTGTIATNVAAILDDTGTTGVVLTAAERTAIADALLSRDMALVTGVALNERKVLNALRTLRNKVTIVGTTMTVYAEDDTTVAYTTTITTDAAALPITASDPT